MTYTRGDVIKRKNVVTGQENLGVVTGVEGHLVTARFRLTDEHTLVRTLHEMHAGEHVDASLLGNATIQRAIAVIVAAEKAAVEAEMEPGYVDGSCVLCEMGEGSHEH